MESRESRHILRSVQSLFSVGSVSALSDGQLLERFLRNEDETAEDAFAVLVERHGPMVRRVCLGVLRDSHAAEDAVQVTFLILARKAGSIRNHGSLASWLYGVARRAAREARLASAHRAAHEQRVAAMSGKVAHEADAGALVPEVQEEVDRLPARYRAPIVLCYFEGLTHEQAAVQLQVPVGTVKIRLARARGRLRGRLARRGLAPALVTSCCGPAASAAVPTPLFNATLRAAMHITAGRAAGVSAPVAALEGSVSRSLAMIKWKLVAATFVSVTAVSTCAVLLAQQAGAGGGRPASEPPPQVVKGAPPAEPVVATLIEARADTARAVFEQLMQRYEHTLTIPPDDTALWSRRWMEEQLRLTPKPADKLVLVQAHLERAKRLEKIADQYAKTGQGLVADSLKAKYFRLEAEQLFAEAQAAYPGVPLPVPKVVEPKREPGPPPPPAAAAK